MPENLKPIKISAGSQGYVYGTPHASAPMNAWGTVSGFVPKKGYAEEVRQPHIITTDFTLPSNFKTSPFPGLIFEFGIPEAGADYRQIITFVTDYGIFASYDGGVTFSSNSPAPAESSTGTASVTQNSASVVLTGDSVTTDYQYGLFTKQGSNVWYVINNINTPTHTLTLASNYAGITEGAVAFQLWAPFTKDGNENNTIPKCSACIYHEAGQQNRAFVTDYNGTIWYGQASNFVKLTSTATGAPKTWILRDFKNVLMACGIATNNIGANNNKTPDLPMKIQWSAIGDYNAWTTGIASNVNLSSGGNRILAAEVLGDFMYVYTDTCMYRGMYVGAPNYFVFQRINSYGLWDYGTVYNAGDFHVVIGTDGFYIFDGTNMQPIGQEIWEYFFNKLQDDFAGRFPAKVVYDSGKRIVWIYYYKDSYLYNQAILINLDTGGIGLFDFKTAISSNIYFFNEKIVGYGNMLLGARSSDYGIMVDPDYQYSVPLANAQPAYFQTVPTAFSTDRESLENVVKYLGRVKVEGQTETGDTSAYKTNLVVNHGDNPDVSGTTGNQALTITPSSSPIAQFIVNQDEHLSKKFFSFKISTDVAESTYNATSKLKVSNIIPYIALGEGDV